VRHGQYGEEPDPIARLAQGRQGPRSGLRSPLPNEQRPVSFRVCSAVLAATPQLLLPNFEFRRRLSCQPRNE